MNWIESETKPKINKVVLCYSEKYSGEIPFLGYWDGLSWRDSDYSDDNHFSVVGEGVTHWFEYEKPNCG